MEGLIKIQREFSVQETYINIDAVDAIYKGTDNDSKKLVWYITLRNGVVYDINEATYKILVKYCIVLPTE